MHLLIYFHNLRISIQNTYSMQFRYSLNIWKHNHMEGGTQTISYTHRRSNFTTRQSTISLLMVWLALSTRKPSEVTVSDTTIQWNVHIWSYSYITDIHNTDNANILRIWISLLQDYRTVSVVTYTDMHWCRASPTYSAIKFKIQVRFAVTRSSYCPQYYTE
jgi:hypothetical protein